LSVDNGGLEEEQGGDGDQDEEEFELHLDP
jgi:hypothetical protein